jgi:predicted CXXCH cytochrome family protein
MLLARGGAVGRGFPLVLLAFAVAALRFAPGLVAQAAPTDAVCVDCHLGLDEERLVQPVSDLEEDVHYALGFGCLDCHGAASGPQQGSGFLGKPTHQAIAALCGQCHSDGAFMRQYDPARRVDQVAEYATSVHGQRLARDNDQSVAVCTSCHPAHQVRPISDPESSIHPLKIAETCGSCHSDASHMQPYDIPIDQQEKFEQSIHWTWMTEEGDLSAPTCNDCHGNHGAAPPGVSSVPNVCGQCHGVMMTFFTGSSHDEYFAEAGLPGCATCHENHAIKRSRDEMLFAVGESVCMQCHEGDEEVLTIFAGMQRLVDSLQEARLHADTILLEAGNLGMEVSEAQFELEEVTNALVRARTAIHSFTTDSVRAVVLAGIAVTQQAHVRGEEALAEHLFRRQGLVVSVGLILLVIAGLLLKIRELERRARDGSGFQSGSGG